MSLRVYYDPGIPNGIAKAVQPYVDEFLWLVPPWVSDLRVLWSPEVDEDGTAALMYTHEDYRFCQLQVRPDFLNSDEIEQREMIRHEMLHPALQGMVRVQHDLLEALNLERDNPALYKWAEQQIRAANESAVQDIANAMRQREEANADR